MQALAEWLLQSRRIAVLTGAGMSTASGIPDFRSAEGLWRDSSLPLKLSAHFLSEYPEEFWQHYRRIFLSSALRNAVPNIGHHILAEMQRAWDVMVITQNVDGLHQRAGSRNVLEVHGSYRSAHCPRCVQGYSPAYLLEQSTPRCTGCHAVLVPDVVLFDQPLHHFKEARQAVQGCDLLLILGTSLTISPTCHLPHLARGKKVIINRCPTPLDGAVDRVIHDEITGVLQRLLPLIRAS